MAALAHAMPTYWLGRIGLDPLTHTSGTWVAALVLGGWLVVSALIVMRRFRLATARV